MEFKKLRIWTGILLLFLAMNLSYASIELNNLYFDPAIIAAGDQVDIIVEYSAVNMDVDKVADPEYKFAVELFPDDDLSEKYITIMDRFGDNLKGTVLSGEVYNKVFRIKVSQEAIPADYQMKLIGRWYKNGIPEGISKEIRFTVPVKKEGIILNVANLNTDPSQVRPGDKFVEVKTYIENVGEKDSKSVEVELVPSSDMITSTYTDNNRKWVGRVNAGESKEISFYLNVDEDLIPGLYNLTLKMNYLDLDDNSYSKDLTIPFLVKGRSYIRVVNYSGEGLAGDSGVLKVVIENTGTQDAESVDVRILKDSAQPFEFDVRNSYVGELKPGEQGVAYFNFKINPNAEIKTHDFKLLIRAKGDTDEGDDNIYSYNRRAQFKVVGVAENKYVKYGSYGLALVLIVFVFSKFFGKGKSSKSRK